MTKQIYIGHYDKVWMQKEVFTREETICPVCKQERRSSFVFCPKCGTNIVVGEIEKTSVPDLFGLCSEIFDGDGDRLSQIFLDNIYEQEGCFAVINNENHSDHFYLDSRYGYISAVIPDEDIRSEAWEKLEAALGERNIKFQHVFGILAWDD